MPPALWMTASGALHMLILLLWWLAAPSAPAVYLPEGASSTPVRVILVAANSEPATPDVPASALGIEEATASPEHKTTSPSPASATAMHTSTVGVRLDRPALALYNPAPQYPEQARRQGQEGTVEMRVYIDDEGKVTRVELAHSSGHDLLDRSARKALERWRFQPALRAGLATRTVERQRFVFRLQDS